MSLSWEWRRALTTVLAVWLLLSLWKSRLQLSMTPSRAPFHSGMHMVEDVQQEGAPSSARWSADASTSHRDSAGALSRPPAGSWPHLARNNASCTRCEQFCVATHAEFHCPLRKCCACAFCHIPGRAAYPEPARQQPAEARAAQRPPPPPPPLPARSRGGAAAAAAAAADAADAAAAADPDSSDGKHSVTVSTRSSPPTVDAGGHRHSVALGVLTESRESARFKAMERTRLTNPGPLTLTLTLRPSPSPSRLDREPHPDPTRRTHG